VGGVVTKAGSLLRMLCLAIAVVLALVVVGCSEGDAEPVASSEVATEATEPATGGVEVLLIMPAHGDKLGDWWSCFRLGAVMFVTRASQESPIHFQV